MSFVLDCSIIIGKYKFEGVSEVQIVNSRKQLGNTASIKLPNKWSGKYLCNVINGGDEVSIKLGYNGELREEFIGYVKDVAFNTPVEIQCEDEFYSLKKIKPTAKSFPSTTLKDLLSYLVPGIHLIDIPDLTLPNMQVYADKSVMYALQQLRDSYGLEMYFKDKKLYCGVPLTEKSSVKSDVVIYDLERNVIDPKLNFRRKEDVRIKIKAISITSDNKVITPKKDIGDDDASTTLTMHFYGITNVAELERQAEEKLKVLKYDGFDGTLTTFGLPYIEPGMIAKITDKRFDGAREGKYFCDAVTTTFGIGGFRREVKIGRRVS